MDNEDMSVDPASGSRYPPRDVSPPFEVNQRIDETNTPSTDKFPKRIPGACEHCRAKKLRCEVTRPCKRCLKDGLDCRPVPKIIRTPLSRNNMTLFQARTEMDDMFWAGILPNYRYRLEEMGERMGMIGLEAMRAELISALQAESENRYPTHPDINRMRSRSPKPDSFPPQATDFALDPALSAQDPVQPHPPLTLADLNFAAEAGEEGERGMEELGYLGPLARRILNTEGDKATPSE